MRHLLPFCGLFLPLLAASSPVHAQSSDPPSVVESTQQYVYVLRVRDDLRNPANWSDADNAAVQAHFQRLKEHTEAGTVILAGRTTGTDADGLMTPKEFGIVVFEAASTADAEAFVNADPAVASGVMTAELFPYRVALLRDDM